MHIEMGCASSTPMIASAGSEMLKTASHVAADAGKSAEDAAKDVSETLSKTFDNAKDTVGTAVTGIAQDLGNVFKEKADVLDETKNNLLGKLNSNASDIADSAADTMATKAVQLPEESASRASTPIAQDADSLRTTTPEPELERVMAYANDDDAPPTPKPTLAELEQLTTLMSNMNPTTTSTTATATTSITATATTTTTTAVTTTTTVAEGDSNAMNKTEEQQDVTNTNVSANVENANTEEQKRPSTTEWEKYADLLSSSGKFNPHDPFRRGGDKMRRFAQQTNGPVPLPPPPWGVTGQPGSNVGNAMQRNDDSTMSDLNYNSYSSPQHSTRSSPKGLRRKLPNALTRNTARKYQREFASLMGPTERFAGPRQARTQNKSPAMGRRFDYNPNRERVGSSPTKARSLARSRASSPIQTRTVLLSALNSPVRNRSTLARSRVASPILTSNRTHSPAAARILPRSQVNSPTRARTLKQTQPHSPQSKRRGSSQSKLRSPTGTKAITQEKALAQAKEHKNGISAKSQKQAEGITPQPGTRSQDVRSRSSRSSTNSSIAIKSNQSNSTNSNSRSPSKHSLLEEPQTWPTATPTTTTANTQVISSIDCSRSRSHTPTMLLQPLQTELNVRHTPFSMSGETIGRVSLGTSSFLSTPRTSPFSIRKEYCGDDNNNNNNNNNNDSYTGSSSDKENKFLFVSDLSSVSDARVLLSPYKLRDRCVVCHKKYVIK